MTSARAAAALSLALCACAEATPPPQAKPPVSYAVASMRFLPPRRGEVVVYAYDIRNFVENNSGFFTLELRAIDDATADFGRPGRAERIRYDARGILRETRDAYLLRTPPDEGTSWPGGPGASMRIRRTNQRVVVPAGTFEGCVEVLEERVGAVRGSVLTTFCPDVGIAIIETHGPNAEGPPQERVELKSFGPPADIRTKAHLSAPVDAPPPFPLTSPPPARYAPERGLPMRSRNTVRFALFALSLALAACGGETSDDTGEAAAKGGASASAGSTSSGGQAQAGTSQGGSAQGGNAQAGASQAGASQGGSAQAGASQGGAPQGGAAQGGGAQAGAAQGGAAQGGGGAAACTPGSVEVCTDLNCPASKTCLPDGSGYGACKCDPIGQGGAAGAGGAQACPSEFGPVDKGCQADTDCSLAYHNIGCCGEQIGFGYATKSQAGVLESVAVWDQCNPAICDCIPGPPVAEDGMSSQGGTIAVRCQAGACTSYVQAGGGGAGGASLCDGFPEIDATCGVDADCSYGLHQTDCCGTQLALGFAKGAEATFSALEPQWVQCFPACGCASQPTQAQDGKNIEDGAVAVRCEAGACRTYIDATGAGGASACEQPFPVFEKGCGDDSNCVAVLHTADCCGSDVAVGINHGVIDAFIAAEAAWDACQPLCDCPAQAPKAEDGTTGAFGDSPKAHCVAGVCQSTFGP